MEEEERSYNGIYEINLIKFKPKIDVSGIPVGTLEFHDKKAVVKQNNKIAYFCLCKAHELIVVYSRKPEVSSDVVCT